MEAILAAAVEAGATQAATRAALATGDQGSVREWLEAHAQIGKARDVAHSLDARRQGLRRDLGKAHDRSGPYSQDVAQRFAIRDASPRS